MENTNHQERLGLVGAQKMSEIYLADTTTQDSMNVGTYINKHIKPNESLPFRPDRLKLLLSYHYFKKVDLRQLLEKYFDKYLPMVFIDSGGFSAATQGVQINLNEYIDFIKRFEDLITVYANLDEIGNPELTYERQKQMEAAGLKPLPVFHTGEPIYWLKKYIDEGYDYIALGGMVPYSKDKKSLVKWMSMCFDEAEKSGRNIGYHGFGMTNWDLMRAYPWKSVDSSSWCSGFRYGSVPLFDPKTGTFTTVQLRDVKKSYKLARILTDYGFSPNDIAVHGEFDRIKIATISAMSFLKAEAWLNNKQRRSLRASSRTNQVDSTLDGTEQQPRQTECGLRDIRDDRCCCEHRSGLYLVALPPSKGSEENPDSKFVGGSQMFTSFKNILGENANGKSNQD